MSSNDPGMLRPGDLAGDVTYTFLDLFIVTVALPRIRADLDTSLATAQLVVGVYVVAYGIALVLGGRLGDRFGRRRLLLGGMLAFTVSSALCAVSRARRSWCSPARCRVSLRPRCVPRCCRSSRSPCRRSGTSAIGAYGAGGTRAVERSVERCGGVALLPGALLPGRRCGSGWRSRSRSTRPTPACSSS